MRQDTQLNNLRAARPASHAARRAFLRELPRVRHGALGFTTTAADEQTSVLVGSAEWYQLLDQIAAFAFEDQLGRSFTARRERRQQQWYWYAYRKQRKTLRKVYLGKPQQLTSDRLQAAARELADLLTPLHPARVALTHMDATTHVGGLVDYAIRDELPISYVTEGTGVPGGLEPADPDALAALLLP